MIKSCSFFVLPFYMYPEIGKFYLQSTLFIRTRRSQLEILGDGPRCVRYKDNDCIYEIVSLLSYIDHLGM